MKINRYFTTTGVHPFDTIEWETRNSVIIGADGKEIWRQDGVEVPKSWSQNATDIVANKYFRGVLGSPEREYSVKQLITRVVDTITEAGVQNGYFDATNPDKEGRYGDVNLYDIEAFEAELTYILVNQMAAFNSPVWFNIGVNGVAQQAWACCITKVEDSMESLTNELKIEAMLFKRGSGVGCNMSNIRSSKEGLTGGGRASGPVSFMKALDANAGAVKSGGVTRRAAVLRCLNVDHPDIEDFIDCKLDAEKAAHILIDGGISGEFNAKGGAYDLVPYQNANHSVRVSDTFMEAVKADFRWTTNEVTTGKTSDFYQARDLWSKIAEAAWFCGDPGLQFDTTINDWNTIPKSGRINGSNPCCFTKDTLVETESGQCFPIEWFAVEYSRGFGGRLPRVKTVDNDGNLVYKKVTKAWCSGRASRLHCIMTSLGHSIHCTPDHVWITSDGQEKKAKDLLEGDKLLTTVKNLPATVIKTFHYSASYPVYDLEVEDVHRFSVTSNSTIPCSLVVHNSEYMSIDDTVCNLSSLNLMKFRTADGGFNSKAFVHTIEILITAMDILVSHSSYPTAAIQKNAHKFRQLGLGYANLGAFLMASGLPYDSDEGRAVAASITSIMTGAAYRQSVTLAEHLGPFDGYKKNKKSMLRVIEKHSATAYSQYYRDTTNSLSCEALKVWQSVKRESGFRNSTLTCLAPTGTIGLMMDCDTTGIEPDIALVKHKKLVGGGTMKMVNQTIPEGLRTLGYGVGTIDAILSYIEEKGTIEGAHLVTNFREEDYAVFDCAIAKPEARTISWQGHINMMAAVQPFLSMAISKTVNMPHDTTVEDVKDAYMMAWEKGLKSIAIYRDGCKRTQPLNTGAEKAKPKTKPLNFDIHAQGPSAQADKTGKALAESLLKEFGLSHTAAEAEAERKEILSTTPPTRRRLPDDCQSLRHKFSIGGHEGYIHVGLFEDGQPGEVFIKMAKEGSSLSGLADSLGISLSMNLQYGVPLEVLVEKFKHTQYEPSGFTINPSIRMTSSLTDYLAKYLEAKFLLTPAVIRETDEAISEYVLGKGKKACPDPETFGQYLADQATAEPKAEDGYHGCKDKDCEHKKDEARQIARQAVKAHSGALCSNCGNPTRPSGSCHVCDSCGTTTGCS